MRGIEAKENRTQRSGEILKKGKAENVKNIEMKEVEREMHHDFSFSLSPLSFSFGQLLTRVFFFYLKTKSKKRMRSLKSL